VRHFDETLKLLTYYLLIVVTILEKMTNFISLHKGQYSGKITDIHYLKGLTIGRTNYPQETCVSPLHYHENAHISFLLQGGHVEKRINTEFERLPGDIMFCNGGEPHQFITKKFSSKNINIELDNDFLVRYEISEENISKTILKNLNAKFLMLKMYKEIVTNDNLRRLLYRFLYLV
jgi:AraC family transcriptional regulator